MRPAFGGLAAVACAALAACGSSGGGGNGTTASTKVERKPSSRVFEGQAASIPGQIDPNPQGFFPRDILAPLVNAWRASTPQRFTEVDAGASQVDHTVGVLGIFRGRTGGGTQRGTLVKVIGSGPLRIIGAPLGKGAGRTQVDADIHFAGSAGIRGTLRLSDDKIVLAPPGGGAP